MSTFAFRAVDLAGAPAKGEIEAQTKQAVTDQLRERGLIVLDIEEQTTTAANYDLFDRFKKVKSSELTIMTRQLSTMVSSGMSLLRTFYILEDQTENEKLKEVLSAVRRDIEAGLSLSDAMARHPKVFNQLYVAMARSGETAGNLEDALQRVADQLEAQDSLRRQVRAAMVYPSVVGGFALLVLFALVAFLIPVFEKTFKDFGGELPKITQLTVGLSHIVTRQGYLLLIGVFLMVFLFRKWKNSRRGHQQWDTFKLKIPMRIGDVIQKISLARWSRTFSGLIQAGVPLLQAIDIVGATSGNYQVEKAMEEVKVAVKRGGTIAEPLRKNDIFPPMVSHMVGVGEETGDLDGMLAKIADFYEDEVAAAVKALASILEPVMIIVVGGIVGFVVVSMYLPMFKVYDQIQ